MAKRYLAFLGGKYYPNGGMYYVIGNYDNTGDAKYAIHCEVRKGYCSIRNYNLDKYLDNEWKNRKWAHIYDTKDDKIVWNKLNK